MIATISAAWTGFWSNRRGNVLMIFAFAMIPMVFATGMGIDYTRAARLKTKLNAIADAAALAAVTQPMMNETDLDKVRDRAETMFQAQADGLEGLSGTPVVHVDVCQPPMKSCTTPDPDHPNGRIATVSYTANSINLFGGVLKMRTIAVGGSSTATAVAAPNMDFYVALDTSPSMALPTTSEGFHVMDTALNCSFACHSNKIQQYVQAGKVGKLPSLILDNTKFAIIKNNDFGTSSRNGKQIQYIDSNNSYVYVDATVDDTISSNMYASGTKVQDICKKSKWDRKNICVYNSDNTFVDSYWYALNQQVRLRVTDERDAIADLMALAQNYAEK
jgi:Flp pilus assembly protein TadG